MISTRVRVDSYTNVHAVAELSDGTLHVTKTFVKASGDCSAPAAKNADEAKRWLSLATKQIDQESHNSDGAAPPSWEQRVRRQTLRRAHRTPLSPRRGSD